MNDIGRPTDEEIDRMEELAEELFVGDRWAIGASFWDDGDVHLTAYSTIGTNMCDGYPKEVVTHRQEIIYERDDEECLYRNRLERAHPRTDRLLDQREIDF